ncbi:hypothetical protein P3X46_023122 [Hevea brasiliensis]|uniref:RING-type E3 ubiquitin transferase n=1 Tax=Hevea brasiliensis TaxID=3981 RepID=A0ABQ9LBV6_HEVBR|nr:hypothetical protein P3X46_023122 [Hevea brasiliensis]
MASVAESLLTSISQITKSVACIEVVQETFAEIGCYFYRASSSVMELQTSENTPENAMDILQSLSSSINVAKDLINKCQKAYSSKSDSDKMPKSTIQQLERLINRMGQCLSLIPSSTFQNKKYAEVAVRSLSNEMQHAQFEVGQSQELQTKELEQKKSFSEEEQNDHEETVQTESDLYPINIEVSTDTSQVLNVPYLIEFLKNKSLGSQSILDYRSRSSSTLPQIVEYVETVYENFYCPLTKQIMDDPVIIESGVTYERNEIVKWFEEFENSEEIFCPITGQKLLRTVLRPNIAFKTMIEEWKERNDEAKIKVACAALSLASSASMVFEAIRDLQGICARKQYNKVQVCNAGILPLLVKFLEYKDRDVRCAVLELLQQLAEDDDDGKVQHF